jgi:hypothetical protein
MFIDVIKLYIYIYIVTTVLFNGFLTVRLSVDLYLSPT